MSSAPVEELAQFLRDRFGANAPTTWSFQTHWSYMQLQDWPRTDQYDDAKMMDLMQQLYDALRAPDDDRPLIGELTLDNDPPQLQHTFELSSLSPCSVLLDSEFCYPNDQHTRQSVSEHPAATDSATDPGVLRRVESLVTQWAAHYREVTGSAPEFGEPYTEDRLLAIEQRVGLRLPEDLRALYRLVGDDDHELGLLGGYSLLEPAAHDHPQMGFGVASTSDPFTPLDRVVFDPYPLGAVRRVSSSDGWIPIGKDYGCNGIAVDLDPGPAGQYGQILEFGRDFEMVGVLAESVTALLTKVVTTLLRADVGQDVWPVRISRPDRQWAANIQVDADHLAAALAETPDVDQLQRLRLARPGLSIRRLPTGAVITNGRNTDADPGRLDLRALSVAQNLRQVEIEGNGELRLWLPDAVESLLLDAPGANLSELAGHPTLWDLTVGGMSVRVRDLAALPALTRLDASEADIDDVAALADLDLRVLRLSTEQWRQFRHADRLPKRLAAAQWVGETPSMSEAMAFNNWLRRKAGR
ncbi:SMI1/KNR4 family protein [Nocardia sp. CWNU-33]|uniref:SMI1/KNR4 family protein n=1 Tax=Nocardia sp. CWNU-33 TaxID=3392117 RepID=UPI00398EA76B